jgi:hypothetical protein
LNKKKTMIKLMLMILTLNWLGSQNSFSKKTFFDNSQIVSIDQEEEGECGGSPSETCAWILYPNGMIIKVSGMFEVVAPR